MLSTKTRRRVLRASGAGFFGLILLVLTTGMTAAAPDGSGDMTANPTSVAGGQSGQTLTFTFTGANNGGNYEAGSLLELDIPTGWTAPQASNSSAPGYVTVANSPGSNCNPGTTPTIVGQAISVAPMTCGNNNSFTITYANVTPPVAAQTVRFVAKTRNGSNGTLTEIHRGANLTDPLITVTAGDYMSVTFYARQCSTYRDVPSNYQKTVAYGTWGGNDNGDHNSELGLNYGGLDTHPNTNQANGYTAGVTYDDTSLCEATTTTIGLYGGQESTHGGSTSTPLRTLSIGTGTQIYLTSTELGYARTTAGWTHGLFFTETNDPNGAPQYTNNAGSGFADIRCWTDLNYSDNAEDISGSSTSDHSAICVVYNVKPKLTFTSPAPTSAYPGGPTYTAAATSTANNDSSPIVYSSETTSVCTVNPSTGVVAFVGPGTCTLDANQAMQSDTGTSHPFWAAATQAQQSFTVKAAPTIATTLSATSVAIGASVHDSATLTGATSSAGGTVTYTIYTNSTCTSGAQSAGTVTVTSGSIPNSSNVSFANAGTYYWQAVYSGDPNNNGATSPCLSEILTVNRNTLTITALGQSKTYGSAYTLQTGPTTYSVTGLLSGDTITGVTLTATGTPSGLGASDPAGGTYPIHPSAATGSFNPANYTISYVDGQLTVNKAPSVVTVTCPGSVIYNGSAQTPCSATVTGAGGLDESVTVDYLDDHTNVGTAHVSATYAGDANHTGNSDTGSFDIVAATATCTVTPYHVTYDGSSHTAAGTCRGPNGEDLSSGLVLSGTTHTNAGVTSDGWTFSYPGYESKSGSVTDIIDKAPSVVTVTCPGSVIYNGSAQTPCSATVTGAGGLDESMTVDYLDDHTNVGTAHVSATYAGDANHTGNSDTGSFDIVAATATCTVTPYHVTYDGAEHQATGSCTGGGVILPASDLTITSTHTAAGTYTDSWSFHDPTGTYADSSGTMTDIIDKAPSVVTVTCPGSVIYNGSAQTPCSATVTGAGGLDESVTVVYLDDHTNVGTAHVSATYAGDSNHTGSGDTGSFDIVTATVTCTVTPYHVTYDGAEHQATGSCNDSAGNPVAGLDLSATGHTAAGTYTDSWSFSLAGYAPQSGTITDQIDKAPLTITANSTSKGHGQTITFSGTEFTSSGLKNGETIGSATIASTGAGPGAAVGSYPITISGATGGTFNPDNYDVTYVNGTLTVTAKPVLHVTANNLSKNEGDPNPTLTYTITGFIDGDDESDLTSPVTCTTTATDSSPAGTYPITCSGAGSDKYAITYTAGVLTVVGEEVGGETDAPTPPVSSAAGDSPLENSVPFIGFLICLAFGALGLLAVQAQRRTRRPR